MKNFTKDDSKVSFETLVTENRKLRRQNLWLAIFTMMVVLIQVYNLVAGFLKPE